MGLLSGVREYIAMRKFKKTPLAQALRQHTQTFFYGESVLTGFSEETKQKLIQGFMAQLGAVFESPNPVMQLRENLVGYVIQYAKVQVLALTENEKADAFYAENPYISGRLYHHIDEAAAHVEEVARHKWETGDSGQDLIDYCNVRAAIYLYYMNGANLARIDFGDKTDPDWFRPLVEAQLVYEENTIRDNAALPLTLGSMIDALAYSVMFNKAADGAINPFYEWCKTFPDMYLAGKGPLPD